MILIHIGTPKTGTTSLQDFLARNQAEILQQGVRYITAGRDSKAGREAHHPLARAIRGLGNAEIWNGIRQELSLSSSSINLLSSEGFWNCDPAMIKAELPASDEVKIALYLRRQDRYLQSLYKQEVVEGGVKDFASWKNNMHRRAHYLATVEQWAKAFGEKAIILRAYEDADGTIDIVADFCRSVINVDISGMARSLQPRHQGLSPRRELLDFVRALNCLHRTDGRYRLLYSILAKHPEYVRSADLMSHEECAALMAHHAAENRELAEKYYPKGAGALFPPLVAANPAATWGIDDPAYFEMVTGVLDAAIDLAAEGKLRRTPGN